MLSFRTFLLLFSVIIIVGCHRFDTPETSFYFWKTNISLDSSDKVILQNNKVKKFYVRYFDVGRKDLQSAPYPIAPVNLESNTKGFEVVPVVYIQNKVFVQMANSEIEELAHHIYSYINNINNPLKINPKEIQFDCDWTQSTAKAYFQFLKIFKSFYVQEPISLSATIRLHQIKYPKITGIPPVDKGVLMYYNINEINTGNKNSIYSKATAQKYIAHLEDYPLALDMALPIFAWGQQIRNDEVVQLLNKIDIGNYKNDTNFIAINTNRLKAKHSFFKSGYYFQKNDEIKLEDISSDDLFEMADAIRKHYPKKIDNLIFYDFDKININRYEKNIFKKLARRFR